MTIVTITSPPLSPSDEGRIAPQRIQTGTSITFIPEDDPQGGPKTVRVIRQGRNADDVLTIYGRAKGSPTEAYWHQTSAGRWRSGKSPVSGETWNLPPQWAPIVS